MRLALLLTAMSPSLRHRRCARVHLESRGEIELLSHVLMASGRRPTWHHIHCVCEDQDGMRVESIVDERIRLVYRGLARVGRRQFLS